MDEQSQSSLQQEIDNANDVISKLQNFATELGNNSNNNILTHLCSGLEKFLGFDSTSKGYDGSGIVYSDLDRLCDGVMGFLSSVLDAVKNENEVTTYDNMMSNKLEKVLEKLTKNIGTGRNGLAASVAAVKRWLEGYGGEITKKRKAVTDGLTKLKDTTIINKIDDINSVQHKGLKAINEAYKNAVNALGTDMTKLKHNRDGFAGLNEALKNKIASPMGKIESANDVLKKSAGNDVIGWQAEKVDTVLIEQQTSVQTAIHTHCTNLQETVVDKCDEVFKQIGNLKNVKKQRYDNFIACLKDAHAFLNKKFDYNYKKEIAQRIANLKTHVETFVNKSDSTLLQTHFKTVHDKLANLGDEIKQDLNTLKRGVATDMIKYVTEYVHAIQKEVGKIGDKVGESATIGSEESIYRNWTRLKERITTLVGGINGSGENYKGLKGIQHKVQKWAEAFGDNKFKDNIVAGWLRDILVREPVSGLLAKYIEIRDKDFKKELKDLLPENKRTLSDDGEIKREAVRGEITKSITTNFAEEFNRASIKAVKNDMAKNIKAVVDGCRAFADALEPRLSYDELDKEETFISEMVKSIEGTLGVKTAEHNYRSNSYVENIITTTLILLKTKARQTADALANFTSTREKTGLEKYNLNFTVEAAIQDLNKVKEELGTDDNHNTAGDLITKSLRTMIPMIDNLYSDLGKAFNGIVSFIHDDVKVEDSISARVDKILNDKIGPTENTKIIKTFDDGFMEQFKTTDQALRAAVEDITKQLESLKQVPAYIEDQKSWVETKMRELRAQIDAHLEIIEAAVDIAEQESANAIDTVYSTLFTTRHTIINEITTLRETLIRATADAFNEVTKQVRLLFATQKIADLNSLKELIGEQHVEIMKLIDEDTISGTKGLLNKIESWFPHNGAPVIFRTPMSFESVTTDFKYFVDSIHKYVEEQVKTPVKLSVAPNENENSTKVHYIKKPIDTLLTQLHESNHFDRTFSDNLAALRQQLTTFPPSSFSGIFNGALLDGLRAGLDGLCAQLCYAYVNRYSGLKFEGELRKNLQNVVEPGKAYEKYDLTEEGKNCAKVCLTTLSTLFNDLCYFKDMYNDNWRWKRINRDVVPQNRKDITNTLGNFFHARGYRVPLKRDSEDGELRNVTPTKHQALYDGLRILLNTDGTGSLKQLHDCLETYYQVCHISTFTAKRRPCNIYEILCWLSGLPCNAVYDELLQSALSDPFEDANKPSDDFDGTPVFDLGSSKIEAYPQAITYEDTRNALIHVCSQSYDLLTTILGTGDAATFYASDFSNNSMQFHYPTSGEDCLDMLSDILRRLLPQLQFLQSKCQESAKHHGWRECLYGKHIPTTKWQCTDHATSKAACQPKEQPKCQPNCQPNCQPMSPLMSYLNDCLPGHLPHQLTKLGCKYECATCPTTSKLGMPCMTPLGFRQFSSSVRTGNDICNVIRKFLGNEHIARLLCLSPKAPSTLPEHFGFALTLAKGLSAVPQRRVDGVVTFADSFATSITKSSIKLYDTTSKLTIPLRNAYGSGDSAHGNEHIEATKADLSSLSRNESCVLPNKHLYCAPYLKSLCGDNYYYLAQKDSATYLSWAIYSPWTLYRFLKCLYDAFCNISCEDWGCPSCVPADSCKKGQHGVGNNCKCSSLVGCRGVLSTFFNYGFTFGDAGKLLDINGKRYCRNFQAQLKNVLDSECFKDLFKECDNFLYYIRFPFMTLTLALWLLSLLYLLHIMVIRLDLLHIKSHLRSPSSHRIAAQSLLAGARVNKLNRVFYLQP